MLPSLSPPPSACMPGLEAICSSHMSLLELALSAEAPPSPLDTLLGAGASLERSARGPALTLPSLRQARQQWGAVPEASSSREVRLQSSAFTCAHLACMGSCAHPAQPEAGASA